MTLRAVFRADAGPTIGSGHVMRSLALASVFSSGGWNVGFAATKQSFRSVAALETAAIERLTLHENAASEPRQLAARWPDGCDVLIVDHYERDESFERGCRPWAKRIVVIDDLVNRRHDANILADSGCTAGTLYRPLVPANCSILAGPPYAIVHPDFRAARDGALQRRDGRPVERLLVNFGQTDPGNATAIALDAIEQAGFSGFVDVVLGQSASHLAEIGQRARGKVVLHKNASNMPALMAASDLAIGAGGVTSFERCCVGLPSLVIEIADNQRQVIEALTQAGAIVAAGSQSSLNRESLSRMLKALLDHAGQRVALAKAAAALVDGRGRERIFLAAVGAEQDKKGRAVRVRLAEATDESWLLGLQREPRTREFSNYPYAPTAEEHGAWFGRTLQDPARLLTIVEVEGAPAGMLRLDRRDADYLVSIAIDPAYHRSGIGRAALRLASRTVPGRTLRAQVLEGNTASLALFAAEGYRHEGGINYKRDVR